MRVMLACFFSITASYALAVEKAHVELSMKAEKEIAVVDDNGKKTTKRIGVAVLDQNGKKSTNEIDAAVTPGDEVIYTITYSNKSKDIATNVVVTNPIPAHMNYENDSAAGDNAKIEFSVDGKTFDSADKLTVTTPDGNTRHAQAEDYTYVRWTLKTPLAPGKQGELSYRAILQ